MKKVIPLLLLSLCLAGAGNEQKLLWSLDMNSPERWIANTSGRMKITRNEKENSVRFDVSFPETGDHWAYPSFQFRKGKELFQDADTLAFDVRATQSNPEAGYKLSIVQLPGRMIPFPPPPADGKWQSVRIDLRKLKLDYSKIPYLQIGFNPKSPEFSYELKNIRLYGKSSMKETIDIVDAVTFSAPGTAFLVNETVSFRLKPQFRTPARYTVEDWQGNRVAEGEFPGNGNDPLELRNLPRGYYRMSVSSDQLPFTGKRTFAVIPDLRNRRNYDSAYCLDTCLSWYAKPNALAWMTRDKESNRRYPGQAYDLGAELCSRMGVSVIRERLSWGETEPEKGKFSWRQYLPNVKRFAEKKIRVLELYHDVPKWCTRPEGKKYPSDALEVYRYAKSAANAMSGATAYWEYFNEQDLGGPYSPKNGAGAWDYMAMLKAAVYGFKKGSPGIKAMNGGLAFLPLRPCVDTYFKNDYAQYGDLLNVHTYRSLKGYPEMIADIKANLKRNGAENMPVWFTESGTYQEGAGTVDSHLSGLKEHSEDQELIVAEFIPKANAIYQQLGVEKNFLFMLLPNNEGAGRKVWGQLRHDYTVKPGFVALTTQIEQLGNAELLGEMKMPEGVRAFLYRQPDGTQSVLLWSKSPLDTGDGRGISPKNLYPKKVVFPASGNVTMTNFLGTQKLLMPRQGKISAEAIRFPLYLSGLSGLEAEIPAVRAPKFSRNENEYDKSIIMNIQFPEDCKVSPMGEAITIPGDRTPAVLQIWNLSGTEKNCRLNAEGCEIKGLPGRAALAPESKQEIPIHIDCGKEIIGDIVFSGTVNGKKITRLTVPFKQFHKMATSGFQEPLPWTRDPKMWSGSFIRQTGFSEKEQAVTLDISFPKGKHPWAYPEYLLQLPQESLKGAYGISFELKSDTDIGMCLFITPMNTPGRPGRIVEYTMSPPEKDRWKEHIVVFNQEPGEITGLRLGMTPKSASSFRLSIRNIKVLYKNR